MSDQNTPTVNVEFTYEEFFSILDVYLKCYKELKETINNFSKLSLPTSSANVDEFMISLKPIFNEINRLSLYTRLQMGGWLVQLRHLNNYRFCLLCL